MIENRGCYSYIIYYSLQLSCEYEIYFTLFHIGVSLGSSPLLHNKENTLFLVLKYKNNNIINKSTTYTTTGDRTGLQNDNLPARQLIDHLEMAWTSYTPEALQAYVNEQLQAELWYVKEKYQQKKTE